MNKKWVTVYHHNHHTYEPVKKSMSKEIRKEETAAFQKSRQLKSERYVNDRIITAIEQGVSKEEVRQVAESLVDNATMSNIKARARAEMDSSGHNFEAVGKYREKVCEKLDDSYLIYKVHNRSLDPSRPSFVFKSSIKSSFR